MSASIVELSEWLLPSLAAKLLSISPGTLKKNAAVMGIRVRVIPGSDWRRYHRDDVRRVKDSWEHSEAAVIEAARTSARAAHHVGPSRNRKRKRETARPR